MHILRLAGVLALAACLPACATILEGPSQDMAVDTSPQGANCSVDREGEHLGTVAPTPGTLKLGKSRHDLAVTCSKPGYVTATTMQPSRFVGTTFLNFIVGGGVGFIVDASTGANNVYPKQVRMDLVPAGPGAVVPTGAPLAPAYGAPAS